MIKRLFILTSYIFFSVAAAYALPATHAYLNVPELKALVQDSWPLEVKKYQSLIEQALEQELLHDGTHHVFYHAQKCDYRIIQDFTHAFYAFLNPEITLKNFYFLRFWHDFPSTIDANDFINSYEMGTPKEWNDNKSYLSKRMLSVNFSLFGSTKNYGVFGECTFKYFFNNKSIKPPMVSELLREIFDCFGLDTKYIPELLELNESIKTVEGTLIQIFVPINYVDRIAFAAQRLGTPYRNNWLMPDLFDHAQQRYPFLTPILDVYCQKPHLFGLTLDRLQGRLLFSKDVLLNPLSGVKIFRYTTIEPKALKKYESKLKKLTDRIFKEWLSESSKLFCPLTYEEIKKLQNHYKY